MQEKNTTNAPSVNAAPGIGLEGIGLEGIGLEGIGLENAAADRLTALLTARAVMRPAQSLLQEMNADGTPQHRLISLLTVSGALLALEGQPRRKARMEALFNGLETPPLTPEARADCNRAGRACRLLRRVLLTGCQKRGEA